MNGQEGKDEFANGTSEVWRPDYLSYLLRLWRIGRGPEAHWQASLQRPGTEEPLWFPDLENMFAFLRAETGKADSG